MITTTTSSHTDHDEARKQRASQKGQSERAHKLCWRASTVAHAAATIPQARKCPLDTDSRTCGEPDADQIKHKAVGRRSQYPALMSLATDWVDRTPSRMWHLRSLPPLLCSYGCKIDSPHNKYKGTGSTRCARHRDDCGAQRWAKKRHRRQPSMAPLCRAMKANNKLETDNADYPSTRQALACGGPLTVLRHDTMGVGPDWMDE